MIVLTVEQTAELFQNHRKELGFVNKAQVREKSTKIHTEDGKVVGAVIYNHCVRKPQTTIYELAVKEEYRRKGIASQLIQKVELESPHDKLVAKCPKPLNANKFYQETGWTKKDVESGKNRDLVVWQKEVGSNVDVIATGRPGLTNKAEKYGFLKGAELDDIPQFNENELEFLDLHWEKEDFSQYMEAVKKVQPSYAVAGDYNGDNIEEVNDRARRIRDYVGCVIVVPHSPGEVEEVPDWAVVGFSTPTDYNGTKIPVWNYRGRDIHILGGSPRQQLQALNYLGDDVVSIDGNSFLKSATVFNKYWTSEQPFWMHTNFGSDRVATAYENSMCNWSYKLREKFGEKIKDRNSDS